MVEDLPTNREVYLINYVPACHECLPTIIGLVSAECRGCGDSDLRTSSMNFSAIAIANLFDDWLRSANEPNDRMSLIEPPATSVGEPP